MVQNQKAADYEAAARASADASKINVEEGRKKMQQK